MKPPVDDSAVEAAVEAAVDAALGDAAGVTADGLEEAVLVPPRGLVPVLLLALVLVAALAIRMPASIQGDGRPDFQIGLWQADADGVAARRDARLRDRLILPDEATITAGLALWLADEARDGPAVIDNAAARARLATLEEQVRVVALRDGREAALAMAQRWGVAVHAAVDRLLVAASAADAAFDASILATPEGVALEALAPGFFALLMRSGLGREREDNGSGALSLAAGLVVEAMAAQRVLALAVRVPSPRPELPSPLRRMVLSYRVERGQRLELPRRLELLDELTALDPTYPRAFATGVILAEARRFGVAQRAFVAAAIAGERPDQSRANARFCKRRHSAATASGANAPDS